MSSFEDIYQRVLNETSAETVFDRLVYLSTYKPNDVMNILYPFLQVLSEPAVHDWYEFLQSEQVPQDVTDRTKNILELASRTINVRRVIDLILIKVSI